MNQEAAGLTASSPEAKTVRRIGATHTFSVFGENALGVSMTPPALEHREGVKGKKVSAMSAGEGAGKRRLTK